MDLVSSLTVRWYGGILRIFTEAFISKADTPRAPEQLFASAHALIKIQLTSSIINSLHDYLGFFQEPYLLPEIRNSQYNYLMFQRCPFFPIHVSYSHDVTTTTAVTNTTKSTHNVKGKSTKELPSAAAATNRATTAGNGAGHLILEPPLGDIEETLVEGIDFVIGTVDTLPRLQSILYPENDDNANDSTSTGAHFSAPDNDNNTDATKDQTNNDAAQQPPPLNLSVSSQNEFKIKPEQYILDDAIARIRSFTKKYSVLVEDYLKEYDQYKVLFEPQTERENLQFFNEEHTFDEFTQKVDKYRQLSAKILAIPAVKDLGLVHLHCNELHTTFANKAIQISELFLQKIVKIAAEHQKKICERYERIEYKSLQVPTTFKEMEDQLNVMNKVKEAEIPSLLSELDEASRRLLYIVNLTTLTEKDVQSNSITFTWPQRMIPILAKHDQIMAAAREKSEASLKDRRTKFQAELDDLSKQITEFRDVGDIDEMPFYVKKVSTLQKQLQTAAETVSNFNKEEALFGWEITQYPLRRQLLSQLEPYNTLYTTTVTFQKCYKRWMDGKLSEMDAETIEAEIDGLKRDRVWRTHLHLKPLLDKLRIESTSLWLIYR